MHLFRYSVELARSAADVDGQRVLNALPEARLEGLHRSRWEPEEGLPCVVSNDGRSIPYFDRYFRYLRSDGVSLGSISSYAQDLIVFGRYLDQVKSKDLLSASSSDVANYRALRLEGPHGFRLKGTSWRRLSASLTRFYVWAADEEVRLIASAPKTWFRRDGVRADSTVRYIPIDRYLEFRSLILSNSERNGLRNTAFAELLVTSGLRVQEANSLLECELVPNSLEAWPGRLRLLHLPEAITKGRKPRQVGERMPAGECVPGAHRRDFAESVVIGMYDAVAFIVAIGLRVEVPIECLKTLKRDCLKNEARGFVDIEYIKGRGGKSPVIKRERVRDGGLSTPGGLIRLALDLSEPAAARLRSDGHPDAEWLWVGWVERCLPSWRRFSLCNKAFQRGVASFARDVIEVDGQVKFSPARMRKTVKAERYRRTGGSLRRFATDHTTSVAARHYAAVDALAEEHRETIRRAQNELVSLAKGPLILSSEEEDRIRSGCDAFENARAIGPEELLNGQSDTWLGICRDFWSSPIASDEAGACSASQNVCLHCPNAVFTARRLPALLSYRDWLIERRAVVSQVEWLSVYADDLARIDQQIMPKFRREEIVLAGSQKAGSQGSWAISAHERRV